ncbi:MAG: hypothetical protein IJK87_09980 [Prevotella sp.]|nr:hypothetical protein [Prevotella sp.]
MKKTYLQPEMAYLEIKENLPLLDNSVTLPVGDGGNSGNPNDDDDVSDFDDLLSKPGQSVWDE